MISYFLIAGRASCKNMSSLAFYGAIAYGSIFCNC